MRTLAFALSMFLSGAAALIFEIVWVRRLSDLFGQDIYAITIVLSVFFAGLGLGGWWCGRLADRQHGWIGLYVLLEVVIAASGLLFDPALSWLDHLYTLWAPADLPLRSSLALKSILSLLVLAVPTTAMGGTLTTISRHVITHDQHLTARFGWLYGLNTLGGAAGVLAATYGLLPQLGVGQTMRCAAACNTLAAASAWTAARYGTAASGGSVAGSASSQPQPAGAQSAILLLVAFTAGFVSIGFELLWTRGLSMHFTSAVYSFATILFVYLLSLSAGALLVGLLDRKGWVTRTTCVAALIGTGLAGLASPAVLAYVPQMLELLGAQHLSFFAIELRQFVWSVLVMSAALILSGLNLPIIVRLGTREIRHLGSSAGGIYLSNSAGAVIAPLLLGFLVVPALGLTRSFVALGALMVFLGTVLVPLWALGKWRGTWPVLTLVTTVTLACALAAESSDLRGWQPHPGARLIAYREGTAAAISVVEDPQRGRMLLLNRNYVLGGSHSIFAQRRQGLWPFVVDRDARTALILGLGTGTTAGAACQVPGVRVDAVEIIPDIFPMLAYFHDDNFGLIDLAAGRPGVRLLNVDGRYFVRSTRNRYDVVIGDLFEPWRRGTGAMYSLEHFEAVRRVLTARGAFWQWLPLYQLSPAELRTIIRTFCRTFDHVNAWWLVFNAEHPALALVGSVEPHSMHAADVQGVLSDPALQPVLLESGFLAPGPILGSWIADRDALMQFAGDGPINTIDRPRVEFDAPRSLAGRTPDWGVNNMHSMFTVAALATDQTAEAFPEATARSVAAQYRRSVEHMMIAHEDLIRGRFDAAVDMASQAFANTPEWDYPILFLENELERALAGDAAPRFDRILDAFSSNPAIDYRVEYWRARRAIREQRMTAAQQHLRRAIEMNPEHAASRQLLETIDRQLQSSEAQTGK